MKLNQTFLMILFSFLAASSAIANQSVELAPISIEVSTNNALSKFEQTVLYPEDLLKRFQPVGATISNKRVSQNVLSFVATKSKFFISKSVSVNGILETSEDKRNCPKGDVGYSLNMKFDGSDALVTDNVEELQASICLQTDSEITLKGIIRSKIILGHNYSNILGPIAINLIKDQVSPLINTITLEIKSLR